MHEIVFYTAMIWLLLLVAALVLNALVVRTTVERLVALDTLALVLVSAFAVLAMEYREAGLLDIALVLAMLGFVQTVIAVRLVERRRDFR